MWKPVLEIFPLVLTVFQTEKKMQTAEAIPYLRADSFLQQGITVLLVHRDQNAIGDLVEKFCC